MKTRLFLSVIVIVMALLEAGCSSTPEEVGNVAKGEPKPTTVASIEAKQVAAEQEAAYVVEIEFPGKSAKIGPAAKDKVEALYKTVPEPERLKAAKIISWGDREYPTTEQKKLSEGDIDLAKKRGEAVQRILKERNAKLEIDLYNMAQRPGAFSKLIGREEARIKESLERAVGDSSQAKARKTIVLLVLDEKK